MIDDGWWGQQKLEESKTWNNKSKQRKRLRENVFDRVSRVGVLGESLVARLKQIDALQDKKEANFEMAQCKNKKC